MKTTRHLQNFDYDIRLSTMWEYRDRFCSSDYAHIHALKVAPLRFARPSQDLQLGHQRINKLALRIPVLEYLFTAHVLLLTKVNTWHSPVVGILKKFNSEPYILLITWSTFCCDVERKTSSHMQTEVPGKPKFRTYTWFWRLSQKKGRSSSGGALFVDPLTSCSVVLFSSLFLLNLLI